MSDKTYTEDDIVRLGGVMSENLKATQQEVKELREDVAELDETVFALDRAIGNVEHKVDAIYTFSSLTYSKSEDKTND